ncbi:RsmG family class I SAM-dependent methyltransferase [Leptospira idonii]|uniref:Ribosomal RNA small subunit methyltransferase G n=1 Tax=Leptospira idonii TaxID=1193500 RepID=A0A4V3JYH9_9LEPT|nr:RsmG family class I SAM-dependent methyltransferase [Leptospira idonii]TGN20316.1 16S rRNA (guanine(527)-N(7))-methyltransferase RsmG [Leptospira idonii]
MSEINSQERTKSYIPNLYSELDKKFDWDRVNRFYKFLFKENERGGFFSKNDSSQIFERHIIDCMVFVWKLSELGYVSRETKIADIGTGPGLPGFLFACLKDVPKITLIDSQRRKLALLEEEVRNGNLSEVSDRISFDYMRAEEEKRNFDLVTSRAVVPYPFLVEVASQLVKKFGLLCPYLGQRNFDSKQEAKVLQYSGFKIKKEIELTELDFVGKRHIKILLKDSEPKPGYPRAWKEIVKETKEGNG